MPKAIWNGAVIAQADDNEVHIVENNIYFPLSKVDPQYLSSSSRTSVCPWKGTANYYTLTVSGKLNPDAAWTYRTPHSAAMEIAGHVAFWRGVEVQR